jgi:hypothetical protein
MATRLGPYEPLDVAKRILMVRRQRVLLDSDLAALYGVPTHRLNEAVKRNVERFPEDFAFQLTAAETIALISQTAISKKGRGGRRKPAWAFTEHGAIMLASVLNSPRAVQMSVYVVRVFVELRVLVASNPSLSRKLADLERALASLDRDLRRVSPPSPSRRRAARCRAGRRSRRLPTARTACRRRRRAPGPRTTRRGRARR